ncbi:MAG: hypothetical protein AAGA54_21330 [Myxococcota bacterium]
MRALELLSIALLTLAGCNSGSEFNCQEDSDCGQDGMCEPNGFCSFPDSSCETGRRYGELAGTGLANECVNPAEGTTTSAGGTDAESATSTTGPLTTTTDPSDTDDGADESTGSATPMTQEFCMPMTPPGGSGPVVEVSADDIGTLQAQLNGASEGTTFLIADGVYDVPEGIRITTAGVTVRSASGDPESVVFQNSEGNASVFRVDASDVTIGELSIRNAGAYGVFVSTNGTEAINGTLLYRLHITDAIISGVRITYGSAPVDDGVVACSTIELTEAGRSVEGCDFRAGLSGIGAAGWDVRDNHFEGFWCNEGATKPAIGFNQSSFDNVVQRNNIRECAIGIRMGERSDHTDIREPPEHACEPGYYGTIGGAVINNMISATGTGIGSSGLGMDSGIAAWQVCGLVVAHNTVASAFDAPSIEYRHERTEVSVLNNLVTSDIILRDGASAPVAGNIAGAALNVFVSPLDGDLHLLEGAEAIDAGINLGDDAVEYDIDGQVRVDAPDVGADEIVLE